MATDDHLGYGDAAREAKRRGKSPRPLTRRRVVPWLGAGAAVVAAGAGGVAAYEGYSRGIFIRSGEGPDRQFPGRLETTTG